MTVWRQPSMLRSDDAGDIALWQKVLLLNTLALMILTHLFSAGMAERKVSATSLSRA